MNISISISLVVVSLWGDRWIISVQIGDSPKPITGAAIAPTRRLQMSAMKFDLSKASIGDIRQLICQLSEVVNSHVQTSVDAVKAAIEKGLAEVDQTIPANYTFDIRLESKDGKFNLAIYKFAPLATNGGNGQTKPVAATAATPAAITPSAPVVNAGVRNGTVGNGKFQGTDGLMKYARVKNINIDAYLEIGGSGQVRVKNGVNAYKVLKELNPLWKGSANDVILAQIQAM